MHPDSYVAYLGLTYSAHRATFFGPDPVGDRVLDEVNYRLRVARTFFHLSSRNAHTVSDSLAYADLRDLCGQSLQNPL